MNIHSGGNEARWLFLDLNAFFASCEQQEMPGLRGNREARRMLVEAAWSYRYPARVSMGKTDIVVRQPKPIRDIAWKAQVRLCGRYRKLNASGKRPTVVVAAIARELLRFRLGNRSRDQAGDAIGVIEPPVPEIGGGVEGQAILESPMGRFRPTPELSQRQAATKSVHAVANPRMED